MTGYTLEEPATDRNFDEQAYLRGNPDVADAVRKGLMPSGRAHFEAFGRVEGRRLARRAGELPPAVAESKRRKLERIRPLLRADMPFVESPLGFDFLSEDLRAQFNIVDTEAVSSNGYDAHAMELIDGMPDGFVLDFGAGKRSVYYDNVVNFEIVSYESTDVRGVGEVLPFRDGAFDAVISIAVLEHVKDPFMCAKEIARVLRPGGRLVCCVPFLQPLHGYPHHYYNMTSQGLRNLFDAYLEIDRIAVPESILPIWSLSWIVKSWAAGLQGRTREDFLNMRVSQLMDDPRKYLEAPFVRELSEERNIELASATMLFAHKK